MSLNTMDDDSDRHVKCDRSCWHEKTFSDSSRWS